MLNSATIELSKSALKKNISFLKKQIGEHVVFSSVIKGNAYGHGIAQFLPLAEECGIRHFSVFSIREAVQAFQFKRPDSHIMVMGYLDNEDLRWAILNDVSFYVFELSRLENALSKSKLLNKPARIHLEIETGLNRTGLEKDELDKAVQLIKDNHAHFIVEGICTHYAGAESVSNYLRIQNQIQSFNQQYDAVLKQGIHPKLKHTACSAAALTYPETIMDMVRFGIAQYGFWPTKETQMHFFLKLREEQKKRLINPLKRVISWKSRIMCVKNVKAGDFVSYGTSYMAQQDKKLAVVPVGYYHGFSRKLSNLGWVLVHGKRVPVVGSVNMNLMMIDISKIPQAGKGDEVVMIGHQKKNHLTVGSFADMTQYLNYEVLVRLPAETPRIVVD